jgi:hypothetical protein
MVSDVIALSMGQRLAGGRANGGHEGLHRLGREAWLHGVPFAAPCLALGDQHAMSV